jgi:hypothetical protein
MFNEQSINVVSNDKIIFETKTDMSIGKTVFPGAKDQPPVVEETKRVSFTSEELITLKVANTNSVIELDENTDVHTLVSNTLMDGTNKAPMLVLTSQGQAAGEAQKQAEAEAAEAERKRQEEEAQKAAEEKKGGVDGWRILKGIGKIALGVVAVVAVAAAIVVTGGAIVAVAGAIAAAATTSAMVTAGVGAALTLASAYSVVNMGSKSLEYANATMNEGVSDIQLASKGISETEQAAYNPLLNDVHGGNEASYYLSFGGNVLLTLLSAWGAKSTAELTRGAVQAQNAMAAGRMTTGGAGGRIDLNQKPTVSNAKLKNIVDDLYKGQGGSKTIGNGTTMDAVRNEIKTGLPTHGKFHTQKLNDYLNALNRRLRAGDLNQHDTDIVNSLIADITKALSGK